METLNMRRKKRKTRRYRDELRKRTHVPNTICNKSYKNTINKVHNKSSCCLKTSNYITSNRLTLLSKTVKSETVTRLQLTDLKNKKLNTLNRQKIESGLREHQMSDEAAQHDVNTVLEKHTIREDINGIQNISPDLQIHDESNHESPKSIILFTPDIHEDNVATNTNHNSSIEISILSSPSSSKLTTNCKSISDDYHMDNSEHYIEQKFPQKTCDIEKWRDALKIYRENWNNGAQEYKSLSDTDLTNNKQPPEEIIIQNPKDYLQYSRKYLPYTITSEVDTSSPTSSNSSDSICIPSSSPIPITVCDSPEYAYYPHRLN